MAIISFTTKFQTSGTQNILFRDTSDWAGQSISTANVNGCIKITSPSGIVIYDNGDFSNANCDIHISGSLTSQQPIAPPLGTNGFPEPGLYTILYTVYNSNTLAFYTVTNTYTYKYVRPTVSIIQTVDCISPLFTSVDATNYAVAGTTPSNTRVHTIDYPYGSAGEGTPVIGSAATVTTGTFYNGTQTTEISSSLTYTFPDGLIVTDTVTGDKEILVNCVFICSIYCCIRSKEQQMNEAKGVNEIEYQKLKALFDHIMALLAFAKVAIECGKSNDVNGYLDQIKTLSNCTSDCDCSSGTPSLVTGIGGLVNEVIVVSGGAPVDVQPVTVGNTTTYTVSLNASFIADNLFQLGAGANSLMTKNAIAADGNNSIAIGDLATASQSASVSIGSGSFATGQSSLALGENAAATKFGAISTGVNSMADGSVSIAFGSASAANKDSAIVIGASSVADGVSSIAIGVTVSANKTDSIAMGSNSIADGSSSITIGSNASSTKSSSTAIGSGSIANGSASTSLGSGALSNIDSTVNINGTIITRKDLGETNFQKDFSGAIVTITSRECNLKLTAAIFFTITLPTGSKFYPDSVDLVITQANNVTGQPEIQVGGDASAFSLLAPVSTTALTAVYNRQRFNTLLDSSGQQILTAGLTTGATGTTIFGRFVFKGVLLENE